MILLVGAGRFERPTPCAQGRCATRLRYAPTLRDPPVPFSILTFAQPDIRAEDSFARSLVRAAVRQ